MKSFACPHCGQQIDPGFIAPSSIVCPVCGKEAFPDKGTPSEVPEAEFNLPCPGCGVFLKIPVSYLHRKGKCPKCGISFVPEPESKAKPETADQTPLNKSEPLSEAQMELMVRLSRHPVNQQTVDYWANKGLPLEGNLSAFLSAGFLEDASIQEKLAGEYQVADLKKLLTDKRIKPKEKKGDLITLVLGNLSQEETQRLASGIRRYHCTKLGEKLIWDYMTEKARRYGAKKEEILARLRACEVEEAVKLAKTLIKEGEGNGGEMFSIFPLQINIDRANYLLHHGYADLDLDSSKRFEIGVQLAFSTIMGRAFANAASDVKAVTGGEFPCTSLALCAQTQLDSKNMSKDDRSKLSPQSFVYTYVQTRISEAINVANLKEYINLHLGKGVEITACRGGDTCPTCSKGKHKFLWSEIEALPKVPRHWGCQCLYSAWIL